MMEQKDYTQLRIPKMIRDELKTRAAENGRTMIGELYYMLFELEQTHETQQNGRLHSPNFRSYQEKVENVIQNMRDRGYIGKAGFYKASKNVLSHNPQTTEKYWGYYCEHKEMFKLPMPAPPKPINIKEIKERNESILKGERIRKKKIRRSLEELRGARHDG